MARTKGEGSVDHVTSRGTPTIGQQLPPHALDAEQGLLGALLLDGDRMLDISPLVRAADFYDPAHRAIYEVLERLYENRTPIDLVTVSDGLRDHPQITPLGGTVFLTRLIEQIATGSHAVRYAEIVREKALLRRLADVGEMIGTLARDRTLSGAEALERAEQKLLVLGRHTTDTLPQHIADIGAASYEHYVRLYEAEDKVSLFGIRTGYREIDELLTGLAPGSLTIVAARPSMGKTSLALDIARYVAAEQRKKVAVFSLEMTKQEVMDRVIAGELGIAAWQLKKGELTPQDFARMGSIFDGLKQHPLYIDDDPDTTIVNLRSKARRQQLERGLDLLIIDYLQLIEVTDRGAGENRTQQVSHISRSLKNLARELGCPIIALSQLSRSVEQRNPPIPILSDLRESGSIEQDADVVLMLYRAEAYDEDAGDPGATDVYVRKNRNGPTGRVGLHFDKARMSFRAH